MTRLRVFGLALALVLAVAACEPPIDDVTDSTDSTDATRETVSPIPSSPAPPSTPHSTTPAPAVTTTAPSTAAASDALTSLQGNTRNAIAWAPLDHPDDITVEGSVPSSRAWSTSKVLVIAAYLQTRAAGDPATVPERERALIHDALTTSSGTAITAIKQEIPSGRGATMTQILRSIGDTTTVAPDSYEGTMQWSAREQVRFMAALANGRVVSPAASAYLLQQMQPIASQQWGLGAIGARAFKPGWVSGSTETRQMGIVGNHAVAIITAGEGPVTRQSDGDFAHQWQLNRLANLLRQRIGD